MFGIRSWITSRRRACARRARRPRSSPRAWRRRSMAASQADGVGAAQAEGMPVRAHQRSVAGRHAGDAADFGGNARPVVRRPGQLDHQPHLDRTRRGLGGRRGARRQRAGGGRDGEREGQQGARGTRAARDEQGHRASLGGRHAGVGSLYQALPRAPAAANSITPRRTADLPARQRSLRSAPIGRARITEHEQREDGAARHATLPGRIDRRQAVRRGDADLRRASGWWRAPSRPRPCPAGRCLRRWRN